MTKPSVGRIVLATVHSNLNNGAEVAPAIITRVWGEHPDGGWTVNLRVLCDSENTLWQTSVRLVESESDIPSGSWVGAWAYWPPRV